MWKSPEWRGLVDGQACPICRDGPLDVLVDMGIAWVSAPPAAVLPGYACVVSKRHVVEPFELSDDEGHALWDAVMRVARGLRDATAAIKVNYEIHGNTVPHLHVHIYPRFVGDPFEGRAIEPSAAAPFLRTPDDLARLKRAIN